MNCHHCGNDLSTRECVSQGMRVRAYVLTRDEYLERACNESKPEAIKKHFIHQQVYTHIDVYSPAEFGETFLFRVKL